MSVRDSLAGEDISLQGGDMSETSFNDIATVVGVDAARQSVIRELPANPGSFARRPLWGAGLAATVFKASTVALRDRMQARIKERLLANPRVISVREATVAATSTGTEVTVRVDVVGGRIDETLVVKPPGVQ